MKMKTKVIIGFFAVVIICGLIGNALEDSPNDDTTIPTEPIEPTDPIEPIEPIEPISPTVDFKSEAKRTLEALLYGAGIYGPYSYYEVYDNAVKTDYGGIAHGIIGDVYAQGVWSEFYFLMGYVDGEYLIGEFKLNGETMLSDKNTSLNIMMYGEV